LHVEDKQGVFSLKGRHSTFQRFRTGDEEEDSKTKAPRKPYLLLHRGQSAKFDVIFKPTLAQRLEGKIRVSMGGEFYNKTQIELVGEGYKDEFTLDGLEEDPRARNSKSSLQKDIIDAVRVDHIQFGPCPVGKHCLRTFTITNRSSVEVMRFEWVADTPFQFSPKVGHLHPGCAKVITVTLKSDVPATFKRHLVKCKVAKINLQLPPEEVCDWDDTMFTGTWVDTTTKDPAASWPAKEEVVEPVPEPPHTVVEQSSHEAQVYLSALVDYAQFKMNTIVVQLKQTMPYQTRMATFRMCNTGRVPLEYIWLEAEDNKRAVMHLKKPFSSTLMR
ncbi:HYDIN protein, partial [Atrichornis clamosus]|nr:HYDIN protein [Atrichornis clamosus]